MALKPLFHQRKVRSVYIKSIVRIFVVDPSPAVVLLREPEDNILDAILDKTRNFVHQDAAHYLRIKQLRLGEIAAGQAYVTHAGKVGLIAGKDFSCALRICRRCHLSSSGCLFHYVRHFAVF